MPIRAPDRRARQRGASLIAVMLILIVVSALGIGAVQISLMGERSARNDRDMQVAWQAAEAALMDAQFDIHGDATAAGGTRSVVFGQAPKDPPLVDNFKVGCGDTGNELGLCNVTEPPNPLPADWRPPWLTVDFTGADTRTVEFGDFTGRAYPNNGGVRSAQAPRYLIELLRDHGAGLQAVDKGEQPQYFMYRVTAMGFGPREDIRAVAQMLLRP